MGEIDDKFFNENVVKVNRMVISILFVVAIVPMSFIALTLAGIWIVPYDYSIELLIITLVVPTILHFLSKKTHLQHFIMYFVVLGSLGFVLILGSESVINVSVSYAFPTFISCLYYNKRLTRTIAVVSYLSLIPIYIVRALNLYQQDTLYTTAIEYFIGHFSGITIEFFFLLLLSSYMAKRTHLTLQDLIITSEQKNRALDRLMSNVQKMGELNENLETKNLELKKTQHAIIKFVAKALGSHDLFTGRHVIHTQKYVELISLEMLKQRLYLDELNFDTIRIFKSAAFLHDVGKLHIPEGVLNKVGRFTDEEFDLMKSHTIEGKHLLEFLPPIDEGKFNEVATNMAYCHHEKWDGTGYPRGILGKEIPLEARIMAAADVLDALISQRLYKDPMSLDEALEIFDKSKGTHFEPCIADCVIACKEKIQALDAQFKQEEAESNNEELQWWLRYHNKNKPQS